jgi:hypothetical protein
MEQVMDRDMKQFSKILFLRLADRSRQFTTNELHYEDSDLWPAFTKTTKLQVLHAFDFLIF